MTPLELMFGVGIVSVIVLAIVMWLNEQHQLLKILGAFFVIGLLILIPKIAVDDSEYCEILINGSTFDAASNQTGYEYDRVCFEREDKTADLFFKWVSWFRTLVLYYTILYLIYAWLYGTSEIFKMRWDRITDKFKRIGK